MSEHDKTTSALVIKHDGITPANKRIMLIAFASVIMLSAVIIITSFNL